MLPALRPSRASVSQRNPRRRGTATEEVQARGELLAIPASFSARRFETMPKTASVALCAHARAK